MNKLSSNTIEILKNFAGVNKNLFVTEGNTIGTISEQANIFATATVAETFDRSFGIYDLNEFLKAYTLLEDPVVDFKDSSVTLSSGRSKIDYRFADESILTYPKKKINMPSADVTVQITSEVLAQVRKAAGVLGHAIISLRKEDGQTVIAVVDPKNSTANTYAVEVDVDGGEEAVYDLQFLISNVKVIPGDYEVRISSRLISHWKNLTEQVEYYIALEKTSTYQA